MDKINRKKILVYSIISIFVLIIVIYSERKMSKLLSGPIITVNYPQNGVTLTDPYIQISGTTENVAKMYLVDREIALNENGEFSEPLLLNSGYNIITLKGVDRFQKSKGIRVELILKGKK